MPTFTTPKKESKIFLGQPPEDGDLVVSAETLRCGYLPFVESPIKCNLEKEKPIKKKMKVESFSRNDENSEILNRRQDSWKNFKNNMG
jgi:hypothetical protein